MRRIVARTLAVAGVAVALVVFSPARAAAQDPKTAAGARELAQLLASKKLDAIAARDPSAPDAFVAALSFPGQQIILVSARYSSPALINERLARREYRDAYIELNSASIAESRVFITDIGADGLKPKKAKNDVAVDMHEAASKQVKFDGNWREDKMSEADYMKVFADAEGRYTRALELLLAEAKK